MFSQAVIETVSFDLFHLTSLRKDQILMQNVKNLTERDTFYRTTIAGTLIK